MEVVIINSYISICSVPHPPSLFTSSSYLLLPSPAYELSLLNLRFSSPLSPAPLISRQTHGPPLSPPTYATLHVSFSSPPPRLCS
ncbi:hypothetical protein E2C01_097327 [Portunus trituberculatus]|uniref:Uncharacterized protein n=1 Tax=Portunus trituberculatus TaxID=210409 RepID=A0A5B7JUW4_PORTR|nr:hypothetical protein [Portunus trituberculatus]